MSVGSFQPKLAHQFQVKFCSVIKSSKYTWWITHREQSLLSMVAMLEVWLVAINSAVWLSYLSISRQQNGVGFYVPVYDAIAMKKGKRLQTSLAHCRNLLLIHSATQDIPNCIAALLGPFHGAIADPSVTHCRCRGHRCAGGARQYR